MHGVTGSGKTLVYMDIVKDLLKQNKQILILLPEKALSNQISRRFEEFLKAKCAIWHSGIKDKIKKNLERHFRKQNPNCFRRKIFNVFAISGFRFSCDR